MHRFFLPALALGLAGCVAAGPRPDALPPESAATVPSGDACLPPHVRTGTPLERDLAAAPIMILCPEMLDPDGRPVEMLLAGFAPDQTPASVRPGPAEQQVTVELAFLPDPASPVSVLLIRGDPQGRPGAAVRQESTGVLESTVGISAVEPITVGREVTVDGRALSLEAAAFTLRGAPARMVCVNAINVATRSSMAMVCRRQEAGPLATARRIVAQDLPAVIF
jgi:hypothetical protein